MALIKKAQTTLTRENRIAPEEALQDPIVSQQFKNCIATIKRVSPRSDEFLYFRARAITAMEAANLDKDGNIVGDGFVNDRGIWQSASELEPYTNQNGDAFSEPELLKGYKTFIGKGLFVNHSSDNAESIRGMVIDARWVPKGKYVEVLVAIDKIAHPDLTRQIEAGYQRDVSMGTQVEYSICSLCGNKAVVEADYCEHVKGFKGKRLQGKLVFENNYGLSFIELSIVSVGADAEAKIKEIVASLNHLADLREVKSQCFSGKQIEDFANTIDETINKLNSFKELFGQGGIVKMDREAIKARREKRLSYFQSGRDDVKDKNIANDPKAIGFPKEMSYPRQNPSGVGDVRPAEQKAFESAAKDSAKDYIGPPAGGKTDLTLKQRLQRAKARRKLVRGGDGQMDEKEKQARRDKRAKLVEGYFQGNTDVKDKEIASDPMKVGYPKEISYPRMNPMGVGDVRQVEQKAFEGAAKDSVKDHMGPPGGGKGDMQLKEMLQRARLRTRFVEAKDKKQSTFTIFAGVTPILTATADEIFGDELFKPAEEDSEQTNYDCLATKEYGEEVIKAVRNQGFKKVAYMLKGAQLELPELPGEEIEKVEVVEQPISERTLEDTLVELKQVLSDAVAVVEEAQALSGGVIGEDEGAESVEGMPEIENAIEEAKEAESELKALQAVKVEVEKKQDAEALSEVQEAIKGAVNDANEVMAETKEIVGKVKKMEDKEFVLAQRKANRQALAEKKYDVSIQPAGAKLIDEAHKDHKNKEMAKATGDGGVVENIIEQQQKDLAVVNKMPKGELRAQIEKRKEVVATSLEKEAEVDKAAKDYWQKYFGKEGKEPEFAAGLVKDFSKVKRNADLSDEKAKLRRAYKVTGQMRKKGMIEDSDVAESAKVDQLMELDEKGFEAIEDVVASTKGIKKMAALGAQGASSTSLERSAEIVQAEPLVDQLTKVGWTSNGRGFGIG